MKRTSRQKRYPLCRALGIRHAGRPFTCRACGKQACWECALRGWPERALPQPTSGSGLGLGAQRAAIDKAEAEGKLLGCCSRACRAKLPKSYGPEFRLDGPTENGRRRTSRRPKRRSRRNGKISLLTPAKVVADIKAGTGLKAGKYRPVIRQIHAGFRVKKIDPYRVLVSWEPSGGTEEDFVEAWDDILRVLQDAGYTLVANVFGGDSSVFGGIDALRIARQNGIVAVVRAA